MDYVATYFRCQQVRSGGTRSLVIGKLVHAHHANTAERLAMLIRDVQAARRLTHANLLQTLDVHEIGGQAFVVQEAYAGPRLSDIVTRAWRTEARQLGHICSIVAGVARGLHHLHRQPGYVHGDVVLENILVFPTGVAKLLDVELAGVKQRMRNGGRPSRIEYTAPEALQHSQVDHRADLYSLGVALYRATTGVYPFTGDSPEEMLDARRNRRPRSPSAIVPEYPPQLEQIVLWALERDPAARPRTSADFAEALDAFGASSRGSSSAHAVQTWLAGMYPPHTDAWNATEPTTTRTPLPHRMASPELDRSVRLLLPILTATGLGLVAVVVLLFLVLARSGGFSPPVDEEVSTLIDEAETDYLAGRLEEARRRLEEAEALGPEDRELRARLRDKTRMVRDTARLEQARELEAAGKRELALVVLEKLVDEDPPNPRAVELYERLRAAEASTAGASAGATVQAPAPTTLGEARPDR